MVGQQGGGGDGRSVGARILRRKRVDDASSSSSSSSSLHVVKLGHNQLAKTLTVFQLISIGVGSTIGAGVYVLVGTVARERSGPALTISFLIAAIAAALSAFCYAELASRCPSAGSAYHYSYICIGEGVAWITGWALVLEYTVGGSAVARGISPNLALLFGGEDNLPVWLIQTHITGTGIVIDPCAAILVILTTFLLCVGVKESVTTQAVVTVANVFILIFVIIVGTIVGIQSGWPGYRQSNGYLPFGLNGMLGGAATVFFAYIGFDTVASTAEEVKNPQRDLPIGIGVSLFICGGLYMMVAAVIVGIVPYYQMDALTPISSAFSQYGMPWAVYVITFGAMAALCSTLLGSLLPQPRILMAMARDGLLPPLFVTVSKKTLIPIHGTLATGFIATLMAFFMDVDQLSSMVSFGTLLAFVMVGASLLIVRYVPPKLGESLLKGCLNEEYSIPYEEDELISGNSSGLVSQERQHTTNTTSEGTCLEYFLLINQILKGKGTDAGRRWTAATSILVVCIGAVIAAVGACAELLPSWLRWILGSMGLLVFSCAAVVLLLLEQDEGRHVFGHSGGFICPFIPWLPLGSILINIYLLANLGCCSTPFLRIHPCLLCSHMNTLKLFLDSTLRLSTWLQVSAWLILGAAIYFLYGQSHSFLTEETKETLAGKSAKSASPKYGAIAT